MPFFVHCPAWWEGLEGLVESTVHPWIIQCVTAVGQWDFKPRWTQSLQEFPLIPGLISAFPVNPCITKSCLQKCPNTGHGQIPPFLSQLLSMPNSECCMIVCTSQHTQLLYTKYYLYKTRRQAFFRWQITVPSAYEPTVVRKYLLIMQSKDYHVVWCQRINQSYRCFWEEVPQWYVFVRCHYFLGVRM